MTLPLGRLPYVRQQFFDTNGDPLSNGYLKFFIVGTSTPSPVYADAGPNPVSLGTTVTLDSTGTAPSIFLGNHGYDVEVYDEDDVLIDRLSGDQVEDIGATFLNNFGAVMSEGERDAASGYTVTDDDLFVTTDATDVTDPFILNLPAVDVRTMPITIKHYPATDIEITPDGTDTIDGVSGAYTIAAGASPNFPTITLYPDAEDSTNWLIQSSHALT